MIGSRILFEPSASVTNSACGIERRGIDIARFVHTGRNRLVGTLSPVDIASVFSDLECDRIIALAEETGFDTGKLVGGNRFDNIRRARICWLDEQAGAAWIFDRILETVARVNREHFAFDLTELGERMQVARYGGDNGGHFDWHADVGDGPVAQRRKLTMVVQLSAQQAYGGGELEINSAGRPTAATKARGGATLFPAFLLHRVTCVTAGERYSLTT